MNLTGVRQVPLQWDLSAVTDHLAEGLAAAEADLRLEQAVYGLDSLDEISLQSLLADRLRAHYHVAREVHYPSSIGLKLSHRRRCDLVLAPRSRPLRLDHAPLTLFDPPGSCDPSDALWLEVKIAYQYRQLGVRHGGYGAQWRNGIVEDLRKMEDDALIREAGLVVVVFNESEEILTRDLESFELLLARKEVLAGFRHVHSIPILDRMGHRLCTVALWPTLQR
jgi:hypothetical protein